MKKIMILIVLLFISFGYSYSQWEQCNNGLYSGYIRAIAKNGNNLFVTTQRDAIFLTSDNGKSWEQKSNGLCNSALYPINSIAISTDKIYVGTDAGMYISSDNGESWIQKNNGFQNPVVSSVVVCGSNVFAVSNYGFYKSIDYGDSWFKEKILQDTLGISSMVLWDNIFYIATSKGLFISTDCGETWVAKNSVSSDLFINTIAIDGNRIVIGTYDFILNKYQVFISTDNCNTWIEKSNGLMNDEISSIVLIGNYIFVGSRNNGVYVSSDNGDSWIQKNNGLIIDKQINTLFVDGNYILAGTDGAGLFISSDNGDSWKCFGVPNQVVSAIAVSDENIFSGTWGYGLFQSTDNGDSWTLKNNGMYGEQRFSAIVISGNIIYAGADSMYLSSNFGNTWKNITFSGVFRVFALAVNGGDVFAGTDGTGIFLSIDNSKTWIPKNNGIQNLYIYSITVSENNVYAGTLNGGIYVSTDYGSSWQKKNNILSGQLIWCLTIKNNNLWAGTPDGIYLSTDNGSTFVKKGLDNFEPRQIIIIGNNIIAGTYYAGVFISSDMGDSWIEDNTGLTNQYIQAIAVKNNTIFACSGGNGIFRKGGYQFIPMSIKKINDINVSQDKDYELDLPITVFNPQMLGFSVSSDNIDLIPNDGLEVINSDTLQTLRLSPVKGKTGETNITIRVSDGIDTVSTTFKVTVNPLGVDDLNPNNSEFIITPNPASDLLFVQQAQEINSKYEIINLLGIEVLSGEIQGRSTTINTSQLPKGLYLIRIGNEIKKFLKD